MKNVLELDAYDVTTLDRIEELELTHFVGYRLDSAGCDDGAC